LRCLPPPPPYLLAGRRCATTSGSPGAICCGISISGLHRGPCRPARCYAVPVLCNRRGCRIRRTCWDNCGLCRIDLKLALAPTRTRAIDIAHIFSPGGGDFLPYTIEPGLGRDTERCSLDSSIFVFAISYSLDVLAMTSARCGVLLRLATSRHSIPGRKAGILKLPAKEGHLRGLLPAAGCHLVPLGGALYLGASV